jgi:hypothetical protein
MVGCKSAREMFDKFGAGVRFQILRLFKFLENKKTKDKKTSLIELLQKHNYHDFAYYYNGAGKAVEYSTLIRQYVDAFPT